MRSAALVDVMECFQDAQQASRALHPKHCTSAGYFQAHFQLITSSRKIIGTSHEIRLVVVTWKPDPITTDVTMVMACSDLARRSLMIKQKSPRSTKHIGIVIVTEKEASRRHDNIAGQPVHLSRSLPYRS